MEPEGTYSRLRSTIEYVKVSMHLINIIDSPGHVAFSPEDIAAIRITEGTILAVEYIEDHAVQTEIVLRQTWQGNMTQNLFVASEKMMPYIALDYVNKLKTTDLVKKINQLIGVKESDTDLAPPS